MNLSLDLNLAKGYSSNSQIARIITEAWVKKNVYCPCCGEATLQDFENNRPVADFNCTTCSEEFELKSKNGPLSNIINDGAYETMIQRLNSNINPNFFFLNYSKELIVNNLLIIPKHFFTPEIIIRRKPLSLTAKRAGWVGCNINISHVPETGRIFLVKDSIPIEKSIVSNSFRKTLFLRNKSNESKGWILDILKCIELLKKDTFVLDEIYQFEKELKLKHPENNFIKDKIRQQLQILRNKGIIEFIGRGKYKKMKNENF